MSRVFLQTALILILLVGCSGKKGNTNKTSSKQNIKNGFIEYLPKDSSYAISFPESWEVKKGRQAFQLMALSPLADSSDKFREDVIVFREKFPKNVKTLDDYLSFTKKKISKLLKEFSEGNSGKLNVNGLKGRWFEYSFTLNKEIKNKCLAFVHAENNNAYVVLASALDTTYTNFKPLFEKIDSSFSISK